MPTLRLPHVLGAFGAAESRQGELHKAIDADTHVIESADAGAIAYYADPRGSGAPLVLLHSVNAAASSYEVKPIFERFRGERPVYAVDLPGFGRSERADRAYTPRLYANAVLHVLRQVAAKGGHVVALSLSSEFAALAAVEAPELVRSLVLVAPTGFERPGGRPLAERLRLGLAKAVALPGLGRALFTGLVQRPVIDYFLGKSFVGGVDKGLASYAYESAHRPGAWHAPQAFLRGGLFTPDMRKVYAAVREPVLVLHDRNPYGVDEEIDTFVRAHGSWRAQQVGPSRGLPHFERPEATFGAIETFLRDAEASVREDGADARAALTPGGALGGGEIDLPHRGQRLAQKAPGDVGEAAGQVGHQDLEPARGATGGREAALAEKAGDLVGDGAAGVDDVDRAASQRARLGGDDGLEQRVVGAAEYDDARARAHERLEVAAGREARHFALEPALFGERHEEGRGARDDLGAGAEGGHRARVGARGHRARGAEHADDAAGGALDGEAGARLDDAEDGQIELDPQRVEGDRADGAARHDERLDAPVDQDASAPASVAHDGLGRACAVGDARGVAEVHDRLARQAAPQGPHDGEAPQPRVEDAERRVGMGAHGVSACLARRRRAGAWARAVAAGRRPL